MFAPILSIIALVFSVYSLLVSLAVHKSTLMSEEHEQWLRDRIKESTDE